MSSIKQPGGSLGLVLEGGGAKGAYAFGVIDELVRCGVRFEAVSGTSVGGLNAFMLAADHMRFGQDFWDTLSPESVYPARGRSPTSKRFLRLLQGLRLLHAYFGGTLPPDVEKQVMPYAHLSAATGAFVFCTATFAVGHARGWPLILSIIPCVLAVFALALWVLPERSRGRSYTDQVQSLNLAGLASSMPLIMLVDDALNAWIPRVERGWLSDISLSYCLAPVLMMLTMLTLALLFLLPVEALLRWQPLLDRSPLSRTLIALLDSSTFRMPVFVTLAYRDASFDPDNYTRIPQISNPGMEIAHVRHISPPRWVAEYVRLDSEPATGRRTALIGTAALPFGIVDSVELRGREFVDGGVADNCPLFPLVVDHPCDNVLIVRLNPESINGEAEVERWKRIDRLRRLVGSCPPDGAPPLGVTLSEVTTAVKNDPPSEFLVQNPPRWPNLFCIAPDRSLGGFEDGVLRFEAEYAKSLVIQGRIDAARFLKTWTRNGEEVPVEKRAQAGQGAIQ